MPHTLPPIDDDVFEGLQKLAVPLVDDINSVLRRLLELAGSATSILVAGKPAPSVSATGSPEGATRRGQALPDGEYEQPLLQALAQMGGQAAAANVVDQIGEVLKPRLTEIDHEELKSGGPRWRNRVQFARLRLVRSGHLSSTSPRGIWELTDLGRRVADGELDYGMDGAK